MKNKVILITGGTGSFGNKFVPMTLKKYQPKKIIVYSRDEMKQWHMRDRYKSKKIEFVLGDIRDKERLHNVLNKVDLVVHAAATKIVPSSEYNPSETVKTNIIGAINVIDTCINQRVKKVVALSTDKACNPVNFYGATKLASDKLFITSNINSKLTKFSVVRYGNVMGSRGSVIPFFIEQAMNKKITITDKRMTRFMISLEDAVSFVWLSFNNMFGGEIFVKKLPSMNIMDIADSISKKSKKEFVGIRPGEKLHEMMIGFEDAENTYEYPMFYKILPQIFNETQKKKMIKNGKKVSRDFIYSSQNNKKWMNKQELAKWIKENKHSIGKI